MGSPEYGLKLLTLIYVISFPTARAVFEGSVHGVVVHAMICTDGVSVFLNRNSDFSCPDHLKQSNAGCIFYIAVTAREVELM